MASFFSLVVVQADASVVGESQVNVDVASSVDVVFLEWMSELYTSQQLVDVPLEARRPTIMVSPTTTAAAAVRLAVVQASDVALLPVDELENFIEIHVQLLSVRRPS